MDAAPEAADTNVEDWSNADIGETEEPTRKKFEHLDAAAWQRVREYVLTLAKEVQ